MTESLTRRRLVLTAAAAALAGRLLPGTRSAQASSRRPTFSARLETGDLRRASTAARWQTTRTLRAPRSFRMLGIRWSGPADLRAEVRFRRRGRWTAWTSLDPVGEHGPDDQGRVRATLPVWSGPARTYQLRLSRRVGALRVHFVDPPVPVAARSASTGGAGTAPEPDPGTAGPPAIVPRSAWTDARTRSPRSSPAYGEVHLAFVHHTVTANGYSRSEASSVVNGIAHYHRNVLGWSDIGYNLLVDRFGTIYEGRAGGVDRAVVGAQVQGFNATSTGIAVVGTHTDVAASAQAVESLSRAIAWKLGVHGVPVEGTVVVTSQGGSQSRYGAGTRARLARVSGHRDGGRSACPGDRLYAQLPAVRSRAAALAPAVGGLSILLSRRTVGFREEVQVAGRLSLLDTASAGREVVIQYRTGSRWQRLGAGRTQADGSFVIAVRSGYSREIRAFFPGAGQVGPVASRAINLGVRPDREFELSSSRVPRGSAVLLTGAVRPAVTRRVQIIVERRGSDGRWRRTDRRARRGAMRRGRVRERVRLGSPGLYRITVRLPSTRRNVAARSDPLTVRVLN